MNEKDMVNDYLAGLNASLTSYANYIAQSDNEQLHQTLIQIRNQDEMRQRNMYEYAKAKELLQASSTCESDDCTTIKKPIKCGITEKRKTSESIRSFSLYMSINT